MSPLASFFERSTSVTLWSPAKGNRTTPFRGLLFDQCISLVICFLSLLPQLFALNLRPFGWEGARGLSSQSVYFQFWKRESIIPLLCLWSSWLTDLGSSNLRFGSVACVRCSELLSYARVASFLLCPTKHWSHTWTSSIGYFPTLSTRT